jgi:exopolysaccharide biosynthesis polyprenyl glycosylphosphotransferase
MTRVGTLVRRNFEPLMLSVQVVVDLLVVIAACIAAWALVHHVGLFPGTDTSRSYKLGTYEEIFSLTAAVCLLSFHWFGMYSPIKSLLNVEEFKSVAKSSVTAFLVVSTLIVFLTHTNAVPNPDEKGILGALATLGVELHSKVSLAVDLKTMSRQVLLLAPVLILVFMMVSRFVSFKVIQGLHRKGVGNRNVVVIGDGATGQSLQRKFLLVPTLGLNFVGFIGSDKSRVGTMVERSRILGTTDDLDRILGLHKISEVFVALPEAPEQEVMQLVAELDRLGVNYHVVPRFYHLMSYNVRIENLDSIPLISRPERRVSVLGAFTKRSLDVCVATTVLIFAAAFFLISAIMIKRESKGPVFFRQTRVGRDGKAFQLFKFRTMHHANCGDELAPQDEYDPRVTRVGRFLRRYSLDELPNFLNVLRGEMSVVGPRPEMPFIVETYDTMDQERLRAKPGVTGLWQISYARTQSIHENLDYDLYYIENQSLLLDLVIIALTGFAVAKGTGAY